MCLATPPSYHSGGASASIADSSTSFSVPSVIEQRANSHRIREVTERHVLLPISSSTCDEEDWDEGPAPTTAEGFGEDGAETIDPILTMRGSEDDDGRTDGGDAGNVDDTSEADGVTICGIPLCDDSICVATGNKPTNSKRRGRRNKQHTNLDTIGEWRRQTSFSITNPAQCLSINCDESPLGRLGAIAEEEEQEGGDGFRPLASVRNLFTRPRSGKDEDGIIAFRKCYSYQIQQSNIEPVERERYALADDIYDDEESIIVFSKPNAATVEENTVMIEDDGTAKTEQTEEEDLSGNDASDQLITEQQGPSFLDNLCTNFCGVFSLNSLRKKGKSSGSSVVSLSDERMAEDGGIIVVRNCAAREIEYGEDIAEADEQLGKETSDRSYPGKRIEESVKKVSDEIAHKADDTGMFTLDGIARVVKTIASTLSQGDVEETEDTGTDNNREDEEGMKRTAEAREHADMVRGALNEMNKRSVESIGPADVYPSQASF